MIIGMNVELTAKSRKQGDPPDLYSSTFVDVVPCLPTVPGLHLDHVTAESAGPAPRGVAYLQRHSVQLHPRRNRMVPVGSHPDRRLVL